MDSLHANSPSDPLSRAFQLREAVLWLFCDPLRMEYARLLHLSHKEWKDLLHWLDTSGLALYFLDRLKELELLDILPSPVLARLMQNLADNTERMNGMIAESAAVQRRFQEAGLSYAVLKGFSLWPTSVPKPELRSQLDLDFLVAEEGAMEARRILEDAGYRLTIIAGENGRSWQFESTENRSSSLKHLYKSGMRRSTDLHLEPAGVGRESRLSCTQKLSFHGIDMPILSPLDQFVGQGLHVYQHVCCEFIRAAHLIEFRRHVISRQPDDIFWSKLREQVAGNPEMCVRLGMVILLISRAMGQFAPEALTHWTVGQLSATASLWVDKYGKRTALASYPGSKLYLLLQDEMKPIGLAAKRSRMQALVPRRLPPAFVHVATGETFSARIKRYRNQLQFVFFRLRFHLLEGMRYLFESILWRQARNGVSS
jgi:hypothetical protein